MSEQTHEPDQVTAWKDVDAGEDDTDNHPVGKMRLPGRLSATRTTILAGFVTAVAPGLVVTNNFPTIPSSYFCG